jgi:hypothetical protein
MEAVYTGCISEICNAPVQTLNAILNGPWIIFISSYTIASGCLVTLQVPNVYFCHRREKREEQEVGGKENKE